MNKLEITTEEYISKLKKLSTTVLWDRSDGHSTIIDEGLINLTPEIKLAGPCFPVETHGEIMPVLQALHVIPEHHILVVNDLSGKKNALLGDIIVESAKYQRLAGIVVFGNIRDIDAIRKIGVPVWAKGIYINAAKLGSPVAGFPGQLSVNSGVITKGDWIVGDDNGMITIDNEKLRLIIKSAQVKNKKENACIQRILSGQKISDQMNLEAYLAKVGELIVEF